MYKTCPKCGYTRKPEDTGDTDVCPNCSLIFSKYMKQRFTAPESGHRHTLVADRWSTRWREFLFAPKPGTSSIEWYGRIAIWLVFLVWGLSFIFMDFRSNEIGRSFMHSVDLVFHEAGHFFFRPFGHFMMVLGGSLFQILVPVIVMLVFLLKYRDTFAASIGLWWAAQSTMDIAPYINDARALVLPLVGGGTGADKPGMHDWENILLDLGLIKHDHQIAAFADTWGEMWMWIAFAWGAAVLWKQRKQLTD